MLRVTLAQMARSLPRLLAAGVSVAIGTAFVAATLLAGGVMTRSSYDALTAQLGDADLVVTTRLDAVHLAELRALPQVEAADPIADIGIELHAGGFARWLRLLPVPSDPRLATLRVVEGRVPSAEREVALPIATARALHLAVGDVVDVPWTPVPVDGTGDEQVRTDAVRVTGLVDDPGHAWTSVGDAGLALPQDAARWAGYDDVTTPATAYAVALRPGTDEAAARAALTHLSPGARVETRDEAATRKLEDHTGDARLLVAIVLAFAAVALVVAALVIANTFQVLVAQRTRTLALLRCIGADTGQLRRSVLLEAAILGLGASVLGVLTGIGLAQVALVTLRGRAVDVPLPSTVPVTAAVVLVPLVVGTLVTLVASLVPARAASRVAPVAALRPLELTPPSVRAGGLRLAAVVVLVGGGALGLLGATQLAGRGGAMVGLAAGVLAGAASCAGLVLGAVYWVPWCVRLVGRALGRAGVAARLAVANTERNPRRTSATSAALLIGVTLVALMATGAASARASAERRLDSDYPVDLSVVASGGSKDGTYAALPAGIEQTVAGLDGVAATAALRTAELSVAGEPMLARAPVSGSLGDVLRDGSAVPALGDDDLVLPRVLQGPPDPAEVTVLDTADDGTAGQAATVGAAVTMHPVATRLGGHEALLSAAALDRIRPGLPVSALWVRLDGHADPNGVGDAIQAAYPDVPFVIDSPAADRARYADVIDTMLAIVVGLLAVAVVIAVIGVANTLSLSVIERRRESATLRALGLTRSRLRWSLGVEGMVIAGVGAVVGTLAGVLYGWAGVAVTFGEGSVLTLPWARLATIVVVALAAGLLASALPARSAARTPPAAALAVD